MTLPAAAPSSFSFRSSAACLAAASLLALCSSALAAGDADVGLALYKARCSACHSLDYNGVSGGKTAVTTAALTLADNPTLYVLRTDQSINSGAFTTVATRLAFTSQSDARGSTGPTCTPAGSAGRSRPS